MALQLERDPLVTAITHVLAGYDVRAGADVRCLRGASALAELSIRLAASSRTRGMQPMLPYDTTGGMA